MCTLGTNQSSRRPLTYAKGNSGVHPNCIMQGNFICIYSGVHFRGTIWTNPVIYHYISEDLPSPVCRGSFRGEMHFLLHVNKGPVGRWKCGWLRRSGVKVGRRRVNKNSSPRPWDAHVTFGEFSFCILVRVRFFVLVFLFLILCYFSRFDVFKFWGGCWDLSNVCWL